MANYTKQCDCGAYTDHPPCSTCVRKRAMPTEPIKACAKDDLRVAKAAGIRVEEFQPGRCMKEDPVGSGFYLNEWSPTDCMDDAIEAAEAVGLFSIDGHCAVLRKVGTPDGEKWHIAFYVDDRERCVTAATMELVYCEAIKAVTEEKKEPHAELNKCLHNAAVQGAKLARGEKAAEKGGK